MLLVRCLTIPCRAHVPGLSPTQGWTCRSLTSCAAPDVPGSRSASKGIRLPLELLLDRGQVDPQCDPGDLPITKLEKGQISVCDPAIAAHEADNGSPDQRVDDRNAVTMPPP